MGMTLYWISLGIIFLALAVILTRNLVIRRSRSREKPR